MPMRAFVSDESLSPETVQMMSLAFEQVCENLGLRVQDDPATRIVAERIFALTQSGARDVDTLREMTLREFGKGLS
jgi:hypothetical protein